MKRKTAAAAAVLVVLVFAGNIFLRAIYIAPVAMYHSIDFNDKDSKLIVSPPDFKRQMEFLKRNKYNVVSLEGLVERLSSNKKIPPKTICITFDDGYENNYRYAYPILKKLALPATIFVVTGSIGKPGYLTRSQIREMADNGISIGSHTRTHFWFGPNGTKNKNKLREELYGSKKILENITGRKVSLFCYPGGGFTKETKRLVREAGYKGAVTTNPGRGYPRNDIYALKRQKITRTSHNLFVFWAETSGYYTWMKKR